jgi:DNA-binding transcriptional MerR regulator
MAMYTIGQFSRITGLSVKTIRLYHEKGLLQPALVDKFTNYRYFNDFNVETARVVAYLRELDFPLAEIREILSDFHEDTEILLFLEKQRALIQARLKTLSDAAGSLERIIRQEREVMDMVKKIQFEIVEKEVPDQAVLSRRWKGRYSETGQAIGKVARQAGRAVAGPPFNLYYQAEYHEEDADIETCFPVSGVRATADKPIWILRGGPCVTLIHKGPYEQVGDTYRRIFDHIRKNGYATRTPSREIYLKGPGLIFRGNPKNYLTEVQVMICDSKETSDEKHYAAED